MAIAGFPVVLFCRAGKTSAPCLIAFEIFCIPGVDDRAFHDVLRQKARKRNRHHADYKNQPKFHFLYSSLLSFYLENDDSLKFCRRQSPNFIRQKRNYG